MKEVLVVAYSFPPVGGAGVQRVIKFSKYLGNLDGNRFVDCQKPVGSRF